MKATLDDLRRALHAEADAAAYPDVDALVAGARRRVAATRRSRLAVLGAVTAAVLVVGGLVMTRPTHQAVSQPAVSPTAGLGPFPVSTGGTGFQAKPGVTYATTMPDPEGAGSLNDRVAAVQAVVTRWATDHPDAFGRSDVDAFRSRVTISLVSAVEAPTDRATLQKLIGDTEPSWIVSFVAVTTSEKQLKELLYTVRGDLPALRKSTPGILTANIDWLTRKVTLEVARQADVAAAFTLARARYGADASAAVSGFRLNSP